MPYIEIKTVHNVVVAYETAQWNDRAFAFCIDCIIVFFAFCILLASIAVTGILDNDIAAYLLAVPLFFVYHLLSETLLNGQSMGKKAMGIKVVKLTGREVTFQDYFIRWIFRMTDILFSSGTLAIMFISSSKKGQRLGDVLANTVVVRTKAGRSISLADLTSIRNLENYEPKYREATKLSEEQALLIKSVLDRYKRYPNKASTILTQELNRKLIEELKIREVKQNVPDFLNTIVKDYVVLTR